MPDRAIIALLPAVSVGFICGIIASALQFDSGPALTLGVVGAIAVLLTGMSSVFGVRGEKGEMAIVGALRGACAVGVFVCMYLFILDFLHNQMLLRALVWLVLGLVIGLALTQLRVRDRGEVKQQPQPDA